MDPAGKPRPALDPSINQGSNTSNSSNDKSVRKEKPKGNFLKLKVAKHLEQAWTPSTCAARS